MSENSQSLQAQLDTYKAQLMAITEVLYLMPLEKRAILEKILDNDLINKSLDDYQTAFTENRRMRLELAGNIRDLSNEQLYELFGDIVMILKERNDPIMKIDVVHEVIDGDEIFDRMIRIFEFNQRKDTSVHRDGWSKRWTDMNSEDAPET